MKPTTLREFDPLRRALVGSVVAFGACGAAAGHAANRRVDSYNAMADFGPLYRKLRYRSDDGALYWWLSGTKYGQIDNEIKALHGLEACAIIRVTSTGRGFDAISLEHLFYTDLETRAPLERMVNPFTGETVVYRRTPARPLTIHYGADGSYSLPETPGGPRIEFTRTKGVLAVHGPEIWLHDDSSTVVTPATGPVTRNNDWSTFHAQLRDVVDRNTSMPAASVQMQSLSGWQGWMKMSGRSGGLVSRVIGAKVARFADVPESWRAMLQAAHPDVARDPLGALDAS